MIADYDVLISGGGPSGLAAAIELGRAGLTCCLVEPRETVTADRPRAKTTSARTMELLRRWGLADRVRAAAPLPVSYAQDVVFCTRLVGHEITRFRNAFALYAERHPDMAECGQQIPQPLVETILREAVAELPSVTTLFGHRMLAIDDQQDRVDAVVEVPGGGTVTLRAQYLLGCDGAAGISRAAIGATYTGASGQRPNLNITFRADGLTEDWLCATAVHYWVIGAEFGGIVGRMDLHGLWWAIAQGVDTRSTDVDPAAIVRQLVGAEIDVDVRATDPWAARMMLVDRYRGRRVFLVGDAAHLNPPWGGHGFNTCVGDAVNLAWKLVGVLQGWAGPSILDSYEAERRPAAQQTIADAANQEAHLARAFAHLDIDADTPAGELRRAEVAAALAPKRAEFHSLGLVLGYHYAGSPIVVDDGSPIPPHVSWTYHRSARPGARLPHAWLSDGSSIFDHLGPGFTLLRLDPGVDVGPFEAAARAARLPLTVLDPRGLPDPRRYGAPLVLVRPDQHIAWRGTGDADPTAVLDTVRGGALDAARPSVSLVL